MCSLVITPIDRPGCINEPPTTKQPNLEVRLLQVTCLWDESGESAEAVAHWKACVRVCVYVHSGAGR